MWTTVTEQQLKKILNKKENLTMEFGSKESRLKKKKRKKNQRWWASNP